LDVSDGDHLAERRKPRLPILPARQNALPARVHVLAHLGLVIALP
jgi:hypothetical protein